MDVNQEKAEAAKACFDFNKNLYTVHVTSDLNCFPKRGDAIGHARSLEDMSIDVFERNEDEGAVIDEEKTSDATDEVTNIPDLSLAVVKAQGGAKNKNFAKVVAVIDPTIEESEYISAKAEFSKLYVQWNAMTMDEQGSDIGQKLSSQLDGLHAIVTKYEAVNPVVDPNTTTVNAAPADESKKDGFIDALKHIADEVEHLIGADQNPDETQQ